MGLDLSLNRKEGLKGRTDPTSTGPFTSRGVQVYVCAIRMEEVVHRGVVRENTKF